MISPTFILARIPPPFVIAKSAPVSSIIASVIKFPKFVSPNLTLFLSPSNSIVFFPITSDNTSPCALSISAILAATFASGVTFEASSLVIRLAVAFTTSLFSSNSISTLPRFDKYSPVLTNKVSFTFSPFLNVV